MAHELNEQYRAMPTTPGLARRHVSHYLVASGRPDLVPSASLLVSELVTNAVVHAGGVIDMRVVLTGPTLRVEVHDDSGGVLRLREPDRGGRGLRIVDALATNWGVTATGGHGKTAWFELHSA